MAADSIALEISADASNASSALNGLVSRLSALNGQLSSIDTNGMQKFSSGLSEMSAAMQGMKNVKMPDFTRTVKGINKFGEIDGAKLEQVSNQLQPLASAISTLGNASADTANITSLIRAITALSNSNINSIQPEAFTRLGSAISTLAKSLSNAKNVSKNTIQLVNAVASLSKTGEKVSIVASALPQLSVALSEFVSSMANADEVSTETIAFTSAVGQLAGAGENAAITASGLGVLSSELLNFMQVMSGAPEVSTNTIEMTQALAQLASQGSGVGTSLKAVTSGFNTLRASATKTSKSVTSLAAAFGKLYANFWIFIRAFRLIGDAIDLSSQLTEVQNVVDTTFGDMTYKVEEFADTSIQQFGMSELSLKQYASRFQAMGSAMGITASQVEKANEFLSEHTAIDAAGESYIQLSDDLADVSLNLTRLTADIASFYDVEQEDVAEDLQAVFTGMTRPLRAYGLDLTNATLKEWAMKNGLDADIDSMTQAEKTMLRYQYVLANTTNAQNDFAKTANTWANQVRILKQQIQQFGIVIGNDFVQALKPALQALNTMMSAINEFATVVSNALGKIFGWQYVLGSGGIASTTDDVEDLAGGLGDASDAASKLSKQLQGFDELNVISLDDSSSGSGSGSSGTSSASGSSATSGEWVESESLYESFIDNLHDLGDYIGTAITAALERINWDSVYQAAKDFGKGLADFLNGLISPELFGTLGSTIAKSLNTVLYASISFTDNFDFSDAGKSIAEGINRFFRDFDFAALAKSISGWLNGVKDFIVSLVANVEWGDIISGIKDFLANLDWGTVTLFIGGILLLKAARFTVSLAAGAVDQLRQAIAGKVAASINWGVVAAAAMIAGGAFLAIDGTLSLIDEIGKWLEAIRAGDWSGVEKADLFVAAVEAFGGFAVLIVGIKKAIDTISSAKGIADSAKTATETVQEASSGMSSITGKLKELATNLLWGIAIIAEVAAAALIIVGSIALLGLELQAVATAWEPVIANGSLVIEAVTIGTAMLVAIGAATSLLGELGGAFAMQMLVGIAVLAEISAAADLFIAEIWIIGELLNQVYEAWNPVIENGEIIAEGIAIGTALLVGVGVATAALGAATVASAGLLPVAIGLGTAMLVELAAATVTFIESLVIVADALTNDLAPELEELNIVLPTLSQDMSDFVTFMEEFAGYVVAYSESSVVSGIAATIDTIVGWFTTDPFQKLADDVEKTGNQAGNLNDKLDVANPELETAVNLLTNYSGFLEKIASLADGDELKFGNALSTDLKKIGQNIIVGFSDGIKSKYSKVQSTVNTLNTNTKKWFSSSFTASAFRTYGANTVSGLNSGISGAQSTTDRTINALANSAKSQFSGSLNTSTLYETGVYLIQGLQNGINAQSAALLATVNNIAAVIKMTMANALQIGSPSKLFEQYGEWTVEGYNVGIASSIPDSASAINDWASEIGNVSADEIVSPTYNVFANGGPYSIDVASSTSGREEQLLREQNDLLRALLDKDVSISSSDIYRSVVQSDRSHAQRTGNSAFAY